MARRRRLADDQVAALPVKPARYTLPDPELVGHYVRITPNGAKSFVAVARDPNGKQVWTTLGAADHVKIEDARNRARDIIARVKAGKPVTEPAADSFTHVAGNWVKRHVAAKGLRTRGEIERCLSRYVLPHLGDHLFREIKRRDVASLLDHIEDNHGAPQADKVLTIIRSICNWYATRDDEYTVPIVRGMKRSTNGARERILTDDELRVIWKAAEQGGPFGSMVQIALLTAQRRDKLLHMKWADISAEGVWTIPTAAREKGAGGELMLPEMALAILRRQPRIFGTDLVFAPAHGVRMSPSRKDDFDTLLPPMERWTLHDLRRSARSLMSRAGVNPEHAERVLGHAIGGVQGIYDRHSYREEKRIALAKLATLLEQIVSGKPGTVVMMRR